MRRQSSSKWPGVSILRLPQVEMAWQYLDLLRIYTKVQIMPLPCSPLLTGVPAMLPGHAWCTLQTAHRYQLWCPLS